MKFIADKLLGQQVLEPLQLAILEDILLHRIYGQTVELDLVLGILPVIFC